MHSRLLTTKVAACCGMSKEAMDGTELTVSFHSKMLHAGLYGETGRPPADADITYTRASCQTDKRIAEAERCEKKAPVAFSATMVWTVHGIYD